MLEPESRECCATTTDCHHLDDCTERPAAEFLGRFQDQGGSASSPEKGHTQTILATPELVADGVYGNCMQAAIATVLRKRRLDAVPHFGAFAWWPGALRLWLRGEGLDYTVVRGDEIPEQRAMLCGQSPRGYAHAVVSEGGRIVWDPHPSGDGLTTITGAYVIHEWDTDKTDPTVERLRRAPHHMTSPPADPLPEYDQHDHPQDCGGECG